jgi:hypothetical protein
MRRKATGHFEVTSILKPQELRSMCFFTASQQSLETLADLGIPREITGGRRIRLFTYDSYLAILNEGAEPL